MMLKDYFAADLVPAALVVMIGAAEISHLCGVFLGIPFHFCAWICGVAALAAYALLAFILFRLCRKGKMDNGGAAEAAAASRPREPQRGVKALSVFLTALILSQVLFIILNRAPYRQGDMTVETVASFLQTDAVYGVNPITGRVYAQGIPLRLKILCLPTLYGILCSLFPLSPRIIIQRLIPIFVLGGCYASYSALGRCLFEEDKKKRRLFMIVAALLIWVGTYLYGMDGFGILYSGWRGVTVRNLILMPWTVSLCLRKKWLPVLCCVIAEACITWTLYGMGVCLFVAAGLCIVEYCLKITRRRRAA